MRTARIVVPEFTGFDGPGDVAGGGGAAGIASGSLDAAFSLRVVQGDGAGAGEAGAHGAKGNLNVAGEGVAVDAVELGAGEAACDGTKIGECSPDGVG